MSWDATAVEPVTSRRGAFWVGTEAVETPFGPLPRGAMYVYWESPVEVRHPLPVVLVHGGGGQGTDYLTTPDGRPGWASQLVAEGYQVFVVDRPGHGRSPFHPAVLGEMGGAFPHAATLATFRPPPDGPLSHPKAELHTQWPDPPGQDAALRAFEAGSGPLLADSAAAHALEGERGAQLLDWIGPAIVVTHSAGGPTGWMMSELRPELVKAHVAIEVLGPPFMDNPMIGVSLDWGLTAAPLTYDPPAQEPSQLQRVTQPAPEEGAPPLTLQADPPRRLVNLSAMPIAVVTGEASPFAQFDGHLVAFLQQARCDVDRVRLADHGVHGNGHGIMLERNNREALQVILDWLEGRGLT
jgi:pimeloyl-ACP methyl ester carboxylesterase